MSEFRVCEFDALVFQDLTGRVRQIRGCPLTKLEEFAGLNKLLWREIDKAIATNSSVTVQWLFHNNSLFAQLCLRCIELCGISSDWIDLNMLTQLLFPFEYEGKVTEGLLIQLNFPRSSENQTNEKGATWAEMLASLWVSTKNFKEAQDIADTIPWDKAQKTIVARNKMTSVTSKEDQEKAETLKAYQEFVQKNGSIEDFDPDANPEWLDPLEMIK